VHQEGRKPDPSLLQVGLGANFVKDLVVGVRHRFFFHAPLPRLSGAPANPPAIIAHVFKHFRRLFTKNFPCVLDCMLNGAPVNMPIAEIFSANLLKFIKISEWLF
jgi:hypothetical protein